MSLPVTPLTLILSLPPAATAHLPPVELATFGVGDTLLIVVVALIVFGPKKLPEISRQLGKLVFEFRKASNDFKFQIEEELRSAEQAERQKQMEAQAAAPQPATPVAMTVAETVSAETISPHVTENTILPPSIQPPASGLPIASERPYGAPVAQESATAAAEATPPGGAESLDEIEANAQDAVRAAESAYGQSEQPNHTDAGQPAAAVPTHHG